MNGYDLQDWLRVVQKLQNLNFKWEIRSEFINIKDIKGNLLGSFIKIQELLNYLCGYEAGFAAGEVFGFKRGRKK